MDVKLVVQRGEQAGQELVINDDEEFVIGRDRACTFRINHHRVSPRHCLLRRDGRRVEVNDLRSATGTTVNNQPVETAEVRDGDRLRVGPTSFLVSIALDGAGAAGRGRPRCVEGGWTRLRVVENQGIALVYFTRLWPSCY